MEGIVGYEQEKKGSRKRKPGARHESSQVSHSAWMDLLTELLVQGKKS